MVAGYGFTLVNSIIVGIVTRFSVLFRVLLTSPWCLSFVRLVFPVNLWVNILWLLASEVVSRWLLVTLLLFTTAPV